MATGRINRRWMQLGSRESDAGSVTGSWNLTSRACLTTSITSSYYGPFGNTSRARGPCCTSKDGSRLRWCWKMGPRKSEAAVRRRAVWLARFWPNLFMHYAFDVWMTRTHPELPWCRYADDGLVHCRTEQEAEALKAELQARLAECHLEMHPTKTKIVYCKDENRKGTYPDVQFDFLGYSFRPRLVRRSRDNTLFWGFNPAVSASAL